MKKWMIIIACVALLAACHKDGEETPAPTPPARRTVVVYMAGENNLSSYLNNDLEEMKKGRMASNSNDNLVAFVDRASATEKPYIAKIKTDGTLEKLYEYEQDFYASAPDRMAEVLRRSISLCPATQDYGLVLWGHANGWVIEKDSIAHEDAAQARRRAYGLDNGNNVAALTGKWMNIPSMREALQQAGIHWKFIFADCCNMANVETAYELKDITDYLIASPAEITGNGAPYDEVVPKLFLDDDDEAMYHNVCTVYNAQLDAVGGHTPLTVIKTEGLTPLTRATRPLLAQVDSHLKQAGTQGMIYYYAYDLRYDREKTLYDMNDVIRTALGADNADYQAWKDVFDQTVVHSIPSTKWHANCATLSDFVQNGSFSHGSESYGGMSMFFPMAKYNSTAMAHQYNESIKKMAWYYAVGWSELGW